VDLEWGPFSPASTTEELLRIKSSGFGPENREHGSRDPLSRPRGTLHPQKLETTSPTSGGCSIGTARSRTQATEFVCSLCQQRRGQALRGSHRLHSIVHLGGETITHGASSCRYVPQHMTSIPQNTAHCRCNELLLGLQ
jgi:hypothetical protein